MIRVLEISLYAALLTGAILLFRKVFYKRLSPALQYGLWFLLILRLMFPFTLESAVRLIELPVVAQQAVLPSSRIEGESMPISFVGSFADTGVVKDEPSEQLAAADTPPSTQPAAAAPVNWEGILLGAWLIGMGVQFAYYALGFLKIRTMKRQGCPPPAEAIALLHACQQELGVHGRIRLVMVEGGGSPALLPGKCILLPASVAQNEASLRYALLHELMHIRRRDRLVCALVQALCCVYWFHPVVRLGMSQMRADMEAACDADVTACLNAAQKKSYYMMLIDLFSAQPASALGMARGTQRMAKRRIAGAALPRRSRSGIRLAACVFACALLFLCFTTACQPKRADITLEPRASLGQDGTTQPTPSPGGDFSSAPPSGGGTPDASTQGAPTPAPTPGGLTPAPTPGESGIDAAGVTPGYEGEADGSAVSASASEEAVGILPAYEDEAGASAESGYASEEGGISVSAEEYGVEDGRIASIIARLRELGYPGINEEGVYPSYAVGLFQRQNGLKVDGIFGRETDQALFSKKARPYLLELGVEGTDVSALQAYLKALHYLKKVTGYFGTETEAALRAYQSAQGMEVSGKADGRTFQSIAAYAAKYRVLADAFVDAATSMLDTRYVWHGKTAGGLDCGGLIYYCLNQIGLPVSYKTSDQWQEADFPTIRNMEDLLPGDIICFKGHAGIYVGDGAMIDASSSEGKVRRAENLFNSSYWTRNFICGKRVV